MAYASTSIQNTKTLKHKSPLDLAQECKEYLEQGFKAIKFGWGNNFGSEGLEALAVIRKTIGPNIRLMLDFGCPAYLARGWNVKDAIKVARLLEKYDIFFLEEALHPYDVEGFAALTSRSPIKIATGESLTTVADFQRLIQHHAVDVVQPDAQQIGITQFLRVAQIAEQAGILCIPHCPWTAIAVAAHLNTLATVSNGVMIEYPGLASFETTSNTFTALETFHHKVIKKPLVLRDGYLQLPESAGLGLGDFTPKTYDGPES